MFGRAAAVGLHRSVPVPPDAAFFVLLEAAYAWFRLTKIDDPSKICEFTSGASAFTRGANFVARVVPSEQGTTIRIHGIGKVASRRMQARREKLMNQLLDDVVARSVSWQW